LGAVTKRAAVGSFRSLFQPGQIVAIALASDVGAAGRLPGAFGNRAKLSEHNARRQRSDHGRA
ncbi:MAG: hypothetical protein ACRDGS_00635, partial [Chloroflexota bacterium]